MALHRLILSLLFLAILLMSACSETRDPKEIPSPQKSIAEAESFVIALLPAQNVFKQKQRYKPLADYLSGTLNMPVKTKLLDSYGAIYNELLNDEVDAVVFGSLGYVVMNSKIAIEPLARPLNPEGRSTYRGIIFALKGRGITDDIRTWKNKRIALVHKSTTAGYIFPMYFLHNKGVTEFKEYFSNVLYTGSHDAAVLSVLTGDSDIGCASDLIFDRLAAENPLISENLTVLASSADVPANIFGVKKSTDEDLKKRLRTALMEMDKTAGGKVALSRLGASGFIETKESEFHPIFEMLNTLGLAPETFALDSIGRGLSGPVGRNEEQ
jgi:phosphonate transport system substrate-binding protein